MHTTTIHPFTDPSYRSIIHSTQVYGQPQSPSLGTQGTPFTELPVYPRAQLHTYSHTLSHTADNLDTEEIPETRMENMHTHENM